MTVFSFRTYSNTDLGRDDTSIDNGTFSVGGPPVVMSVSDNDLMFDDEIKKNGQTYDKNQQTLAVPFDGTYPAGLVVQSVYHYTIVNNTTGQTGSAYLIRIYTGTDPSAPGVQNGTYYNAFSIPVHPGDSITLSHGNIVGQTAYSNLLICFTAGTLITTPKGQRPVETLRPGDLVTTKDNGPQPLRWIGQRQVRGVGPFAPIRIEAGALGTHNRLCVSPNHRILITAAANDLLFGAQEVLIAAKHLLGSPGISRLETDSLCYLHLLFDRHEIVFANDTQCESFFPGLPALKALAPAARQQLLSLCPGISASVPFRHTARPCLSRQESVLLRRSQPHERRPQQPIAR